MITEIEASRATGPARKVLNITPRAATISIENQMPRQDLR